MKTKILLTIPVFVLCLVQLSFTQSGPGALQARKHGQGINLPEGDIVGKQMQAEQALPQFCDTLHFPLPGTPTVFTVLPPESGFVCGNNSYGDLAKADFFEPGEVGKKLARGLFDFAYITMMSGEDPDIDFIVWDNQGEGGLPGNAIGTASIPLSEIFDDVENGRTTSVTFDPPVDIFSPFYLGLMLPVTEGDTLALICTDEGDVQNGTAFEMWFDGDWFAFSDEMNWDLDIQQAIYAVYCDQDFGLDDETLAGNYRIYPNPATDELIVESQGGTSGMVSLMDIRGRILHETIIEGKILRINTRQLTPGIYVLRTHSKKGMTSVSKILKR